MNPGSHQHQRQSRALAHGFPHVLAGSDPPSPLPTSRLRVLSPRLSCCVRVCACVAVGGVPDRDRRGAAGRPTRHHRPQKGAPTNRPSPSIALPLGPTVRALLNPAPGPRYSAPLHASSPHQSTLSLLLIPLATTIVQTFFGANVFRLSSYENDDVWTKLQQGPRKGGVRFRPLRRVFT